MEWAISCCTSENETFSSDFQTLCPMEGDLSCKFHVGWTTHESFSLLQRHFCWVTLSIVIVSVLRWSQYSDRLSIVIVSVCIEIVSVMRSSQYCDLQIISVSWSSQYWYCDRKLVSASWSFQYRDHISIETVSVLWSSQYCDRLNI